MKKHLPALLPLLLLLATAGGALAHPADALRHDLRLRFAHDLIELESRVVVGPLVAPRIWDDLDADADGLASPQEAHAWAVRYLEQLTVSIDDQRLACTSDPARLLFPASREELLGGATGELLLGGSCQLPALPAGDHALEVAGAAYDDISIYDVKALGRPGLVVREASQVRPDGARFPLLAKQSIAPPANQPAGELGAPAQPAGDELLERLRGAELGAGFLAWTLLLALVFGALHALTPGHGKTLVAAYLVGSRGTIRHAIALGGIVTFTHTASVLLLGALLLSFSQTIRLERIVPGLTAGSGLLVALLGLRLLRQRILKTDGRQRINDTDDTDARTSPDGYGLVGHGEAHSHGHDEARSHEHGHDHSHEHGHDHSHAHGQGQDEAHSHGHDEEHGHAPGQMHAHGHGHTHAHGRGHSHALPERLSARGLIAMGIAGGLVPCPEALAILIVAVAIGRLALGMLMIVSFSLGLASVLIGIGVALVLLKGRLGLRGDGRLLRWLPPLSALLVTLLGLALLWQGLAQF